MRNWGVLGKPLLRAFREDDDGATAIEYALIAALISIGIIGAVLLLGDEVRRLFEYTQGEVTNATSSGK